MKRWLGLLVCLAFIFAIAGCGSNVSEKYPGKWIAFTKSKLDTAGYIQKIEIAKSGETFTIRATGSANGKSIHSNFSSTNAIISNDKLTAADQTFSYNASTDTITWNGNEFKRETAELLAQAEEVYKKNQTIREDPFKKY